MSSLLMAFASLSSLLKYLLWFLCFFLDLYFFLFLCLLPLLLLLDPFLCSVTCSWVSDGLEEMRADRFLFLFLVLVFFVLARLFLFEEDQVVVEGAKARTIRLMLAFKTKKHTANLAVLIRQKTMPLNL